VDDRSYRDRLELTSDEFFRKLRAGLDAGTSQPPPQAFTDAYQDAARAGDHVIAVIILSALSGTFANGDAAARRLELVTRYRPTQCLVTPITPVIAAHAGIGAWGVFYQNED